GCARQAAGGLPPLPEPHRAEDLRHRRRAAPALEHRLGGRLRRIQRLHPRAGVPAPEHRRRAAGGLCRQQPQLHPAAQQVRHDAGLGLQRLQCGADLVPHQRLRPDPQHRAVAGGQLRPVRPVPGVEGDREADPVRQASEPAGRGAAVRRLVPGHPRPVRLQPVRPARALRLGRVRLPRLSGRAAACGRPVPGPFDPSRSFPNIPAGRAGPPPSAGVSMYPLVRRLSLASLLLLSLSVLFPAHAQTSYFFPATPVDPDPAVPTPEEFLGYPIGSRYTRHDELVAYFEELARVSPRVKVERIGRTYEGRPLLLATITDPANHANLEQLRQAHNSLVDPSAPESAASGAPVVVWLTYSVHGAETSSGEAALLTAWFLAADRSESTRRWLREAVVLVDPAQNPDGRDRTANWHNAWGSNPPSADPADREHVEPFPGGRFNHYLTDLNRDWLALAQADSVPKVEHFHRWYPNVQIDFHEMGKDSTYYFEPSPKSMESPLLPKSSYEANKVVARYHAQALDAIGSLYYSGENFDNFSPIYGSTYPDFHGAVGATVEQASSRGRVQETVNGPLEFRFTIRNHLNVGLATVRGAVEQKEYLFRLQKDFFRSALDQASKHPARAWVFGDGNDPTLSRRLLSLLLKHRIEVHGLERAVEVDGKRFEPGSAWVVPARQPAFRLAHAIFEFTPPVKGDVFYSGTSYAVA